MKLSQQEALRLLGDMAAAKGDPVFLPLLTLLDHYIELAREQTDVEEDYGRLRFRQGEIAAYNRVKGALTFTPPKGLQKTS